MHAHSRRGEGEKVTRAPRLVSPTCSCIDPRNCKYLPSTHSRCTYASFPRNFPPLFFLSPFFLVSLLRNSFSPLASRRRMHWFYRSIKIQESAKIRACGLLTVGIWQCSKLIFNGALDYVRLHKNRVRAEIALNDSWIKGWKYAGNLYLSRKTLIKYREIFKPRLKKKKRNIIINRGLPQYRFKISNELFSNSQLFDKFNYLKYLTNYSFLNSQTLGAFNLL